MEGMPGTKMFSLILLFNQVAYNPRGCHIIIFRACRIACVFCKAAGWGRLGQTCTVFSIFLNLTFPECLDSTSLCLAWMFSDCLCDRPPRMRPPKPGQRAWQLSCQFSLCFSPFTDIQGIIRVGMLLPFTSPSFL